MTTPFNSECLVRKKVEKGIVELRAEQLLNGNRVLVAVLTTFDSVDGRRAAALLAEAAAEETSPPAANHPVPHLRLVGGSASTPKAVTK